jgi:hypothetical protein
LSSFEQEKWSELEIEAINSYLKTTLSSIEVDLDVAMTDITNEWSLTSRLNQDSSQQRQVSASASSNGPMHGKSADIFKMFLFLNTDNAQDSNHF